METYAIKNLSFRYPETGIDVLKDITFSVNEGEFITVCGPSGCGKSTLLRHLKPDLSPHGVLSGEILFEEKPISDLSHREQSSKIGFVMQSPENQIVTDKVWHELAFGLESLGYDNNTIRKRVAETASFFGIQNYFEKSVLELSGGQKQILNLASIQLLTLLKRSGKFLKKKTVKHFFLCLLRCRYGRLLQKMTIPTVP